MNIKYIKSAIKLLTVISLFSLGIFAQATVKNDLSSARWILTELNNRAVGKTRAFLEIDRTENRVTGNAGCNRMFGEVRIMGRKIDFGSIGTTKMFCSGAMREESAFTDALARATRFEKTGATLKLYARNRLVLKFRAADRNPDSNDDADSVKLEDKKWFLETIKGKNLPKIESAPFIVFNASEKSAGGDTGCNSFGGNYEAEGDKIRIHDIISTLRACIEDERMNVERDFKNGLEKANRYEIVKNRLNLYQGKTLFLSFRGENK